MWRMRLMQEQFSIKESIQSLGDPDGTCFLRALPYKNASARRGIRERVRILG
jgi:hypothetical protein